MATYSIKRRGYLALTHVQRGRRRHVRRPARLTQLLLLSVASLGPAFAYAALSAVPQRGEKIVNNLSPKSLADFNEESRKNYSEA
jgi:hypothetical protein